MVCSRFSAWSNTSAGPAHRPPTQHTTSRPPSTRPAANPLPPSTADPQRRHPDYRTPTTCPHPTRSELTGAAEPSVRPPQAPPRQRDRGDCSPRPPDCLPTNVRVVPDLGDELLMVFDRLEAQLGSVAVWEGEDNVELPAPFAEGKALGALQPWQAWCGPPKDAANRSLCRAGCPVAAGPAAAGCRCTSCRYPTRRSRRWSTPCRFSPCSGAMTTSAPP